MTIIKTSLAAIIIASLHFSSLSIHTKTHPAPSLKKQETIINACNAHQYIGYQAIVQGKVASVYKSKKGNIFLNLEKPYPYQCFTAVIFANALPNFKGYFNEQMYINKTIQVSGFIKEYKGKPEIIVNYPDQINIIK